MAQITQPSKPAIALSTPRELLKRSFDYFNGVENRYGFSWKRYSLGSSISESGGATPVFWEFRNPSQSNLIAVIEKLTVHSSIVDDMLFYLGATSTDQAGGVPSFPQRIDSRIGTIPTGLICTLGVNGGGANFPGNANQLPFGRIKLQANVPQEIILTIDQQFVIGPGDALYVTPTIGVPAATVDAIFMMWRERTLLEFEKSSNYGNLL